MKNFACGYCSAKKKRESVVRLKNFTPESFQLWKDLEVQIKEVVGKYGNQLENIVYDEEKNTKSFTVLYDTTENANRGLISATQLLFKNGIEVELVSSIDCPEQPENTSLHKAEALIDEAEKSIDKLRHT